MSKSISPRQSGSLAGEDKTMNLHLISRQLSAQENKQKIAAAKALLDTLERDLSQALALVYGSKYALSSDRIQVKDIDFISLKLLETAAYRAGMNTANISDVLAHIFTQEGIS